MSAHTPGPWFLAKDKTHPWIVQCNTQFPDAPNTVCSVAYKPNAPLIAAAPKLLDALKDMLAGWRYIRTHHGDLYVVGWDRCEDGATAAIAKATGGES